MNFVHSDKLSGLLIEIELPLNTRNNISDEAIFGDEHIKLLLELVLVNTMLHVRGMQDVPPW